MQKPAIQCPECGELSATILGTRAGTDPESGDWFMVYVISCPCGFGPPQTDSGEPLFGPWVRSLVMSEERVETGPVA